eukprot:scaffold234839_cov14-Prasinocladus_malaysianus.AAC.1
MKNRRIFRQRKASVDKTTIPAWHLSSFCLGVVVESLVGCCSGQLRPGDIADTALKHQSTRALGSSKSWAASRLTPCHLGIL